MKILNVAIHNDYNEQCMGWITMNNANDYNEQWTMNNEQWTRITMTMNNDYTTMYYNNLNSNENFIVIHG